MNNNIKAGLPNWLDGRTMAVLAALVALGGIAQTSQYAMEQRLSGDIDDLRDEVRTELDKVREELRTEIDKVRDDMGKLDGRLRAVEVDLATVRAVVVGFASGNSAGEADRPPVEGRTKGD